jgi:hypothetical protein
MAQIISKDELKSAITLLQTIDEVADSFGVEVGEIKESIKLNYDSTFTQLKKQFSAQVKVKLNSELIMNSKQNKNTRESIEKNVFAVSDKPTQKPISVPHIRVVNNYMIGMNKSDSYKEVFGKDLKSTNISKSVNMMFKRPEVIEYIEQKNRELEAVAKISKEKVLKSLIEIMEGSVYEGIKVTDEKSVISAASQISKMMGYDAPTKVENTVFTLDDLINNLSANVD